MDFALTFILVSISVGIIAGALISYKITSGDNLETPVVLFLSFIGAIIGALIGAGLALAAIYVPIVFVAILIVSFLIFKLEKTRRAKNKTSK